LRRRITVRREKRKKNSAFLNKRWAVEKNMTNIVDNFVGMKGVEKR